MNEIAQQLEFPELIATITRYCAFSLGRQEVENLTPSYTRIVVESELRRAREALQLVIQYGAIPFSGIRDIRTTLETALKDGICLPSDLLDVAAHGEGCDKLVRFIRESELQFQYLSEYVEALEFSLGLSDEITVAISDSGEVRDDASPALKALKKEYRLCEADISAAAKRFVKEHSNQLMENITTTRNGRVVVLVKISEKNKIKGIIHGESSSGQTAYIEPENLMILNNKLQSLEREIEDEIMRILFSLSQRVKEHADQYKANLETLALLDSLNARALWAKEYDAIIAELNDEKKIMIKGARHPLIAREKVVANSYYLEAPKQILLITGPNTGGKTVSLKIIGLYIYMTLCGMAVCAEEASIPLVDNIFMDMGDDQSITQSLSTFSSHLVRLAEICQSASTDSLVLLDEIGGGTDPQEGEALAVGVLDYLRQLKTLTVVTTHYSGLKTYGKLHEDVLLASVEFDVENLQPTYRYLEGYTGQSNALEIAEKYGVLPAVISRAKEHYEESRTREEVLLEELEKDRLLLDKMKEDFLIEQETLQKQQTELQTEKKIFNVQKAELLNEAKAKADEYVTEVRSEAEEILQEIKKIQGFGKVHEAIDLEKKLDSLHEKSEEETLTDYIPQLGDIVRLAGANQQGEIITLYKDQAEILVNGLRLKTAANKLEFVKKKSKQQTVKSSYRVDRGNTVSLELNLIGMRVEEALLTLDKYLDDCLLANLKTVRIVHGHGTGALRTAVQERLKKNPYVQSFQLAPQQEGGSGATIVQFLRKS